LAPLTDSRRSVPRVDRGVSQSSEGLDIFTDETIFTVVVKNTNPVKNQLLEPWALAAIRDLPGVLEVQAPAGGVRADAVLRVAGLRRPILVEMKRHADAVAAHLVGGQIPASERSRWLLVAETTTAGARDALAEQGVGYVDAAGNANIVMPGFIVRTGSFTAGAVIVAPKSPSTPTRLSGKAGLVAQALLLDRERAWRVGDLADVADVSDGLAHRVLARLEMVGVVVADGRGPAKTRRVGAPAALLDLWAEEDAEPKARRTAAYLLGRPGKPLGTLASSRLVAAGIAHEVTGVAAASLTVPVLTSVAVTEVRVAAAGAVAEILTALDARQVEQGANLVLVQGDDDTELRFRHQVADTWVAAVTRVYLDALRDPRRGREQAVEFRRAVLGF
jgi:hypothetical protein